jgi:4-hydroxyphenylpyruvate dioxygenase-like putative hemolysin
MADLFDNPMGTDGFEFVEYTAPDPERCARCSSAWASRWPRATAART